MPEMPRWHFGQAFARGSGPGSARACPERKGWQAFKNMPSWTFMDDLRTFHAAFSDGVGRTRAASYGPGVARLADIAADKARIIFDRAVRWYERTTELEDEGPEHEPELDAFRAAHGDV